MDWFGRQDNSTTAATNDRSPFRYALLLLALNLLRPPNVSGATNVVPNLPVETFFRHSETHEMSLSPDGKFIVATMEDHGWGKLISINLETGRRKTIVSHDCRAIRWLTDERLLVAIVDRFPHRLLAVNRDGSKSRRLHVPVDLNTDPPLFPPRLGSVLSRPDAEPDTILITQPGRNRFLKYYDLHPDVWRINFLTGKSSLEEKNPGDVLFWIVDKQGEICGAIAAKKGGEKLLYRQDKNHPWEVVHESESEDSRLSSFRSLSAQDQFYVFAREGKATVGVYLFDPIQKRLGPCLWRHNEFDPLTVMKAHGQISGVFYEADRVQVDWLNQAFKAIQAQVDEALPDCVNLFINQSEDGAKFLFKSFSDRSPGSFYLVDTNRHEFSVMGNVAGWVPADQMARVKPIQYKSRDGLDIHGYLTLPIGSKGTNLAMVVVPHGGPVVRDSWQFGPEVQFLVNRGYAVLQMNFRGSTGYGSAFRKAGDRQWGRKMQDDIVDGVHWAIDNGIADRRRIAIFGASYGGYAALMGLISTPELFKCGICCGGMANLPTYLKRKTLGLPEEFAAYFRARIGDYREEKEALDAVSPALHVDAIKAPLLLAYGGRDTDVRIEQGKELAKALSKAGKKYEIIIERSEGHGFYRERHQYNLFRKIEQFLQTNLAPTSP